MASGGRQVLLKEIHCPLGEVSNRGNKKINKPSDIFSGVVTIRSLIFL